MDYGPGRWGGPTQWQKRRRCAANYAACATGEPMKRNLTSEEIDVICRAYATTAIQTLCTTHHLSRGAVKRALATGGVTLRAQSQRIGSPTPRRRMSWREAAASRYREAGLLAVARLYDAA